MAERVFADSARRQRDVVTVWSISVLKDSKTEMLGTALGHAVLAHALLNPIRIFVLPLVCSAAPSAHYFSWENDMIGIVTLYEFLYRL